MLHTWGRDPQTFHPHIHYVVPGGGVKVDENGQAVSWQATPENFFVHHKTLTKIYKAKLADALREANLYELVPQEAWQKKFVVDIQPVGDGTAALKYLAPYVHRVAINNKRIVEVNDKTVTYTVHRSTSRERRGASRRFVGQEPAASALPLTNHGKGRVQVKTITDRKATATSARQLTKFKRQPIQPGSDRTSQSKFHRATSRINANSPQHSPSTPRPNTPPHLVTQKQSPNNRPYLEQSP